MLIKTNRVGRGRLTTYTGGRFSISSDPMIKVILVVIYATADETDA